jgi:hypothetical protein
MTAQTERPVASAGCNEEVQEIIRFTLSYSLTAAPG